MSERELFIQERVVPYYTAMSCLLTLMSRGHVANRAWEKDREKVCEFALVGQGYFVRLFCRNKGMRPFIAEMTHPFPHKAYLGRLKKTGEVHLFDYGLKVFFNFLFEEGIDRAFVADLEAALDEHAPGREEGLACESGCGCTSGCAKARPGIFH